LELSYDRIANSYVTHVLVAINAGDRAAPFRDFMDNWYAFNNGEANLLTSGSRPRWFNNPDAVKFGNALNAMHFKSVAADKILKLARDDPEKYHIRRKEKDPLIRLMVDHSVPLLHIRDRLLFNPKAQHTEETVRSILCRWYRLGVITADEDHRLNGKGLQSRMPDSWDENDVFARYHEVEIAPA